MVACTQTLACDEGTKVLEAGGNALEAAIAIQLALAVVEPQHVSLLGGGGLMMKAPGKPARFLDFREEAPAAYHPKTFCKGVQCWKDGDPTCSCEGGADTNGCSGGQTFGVPGVPAMIMRLYEDKLVTRPLRELAAGALRLAREGFPMYDFLYSQIVDKQHLLCWNAAATEVFLTPDCTMPKVAVNDTFQQPWLAETLEKYFQSPETLAAFYHGDMAHTLVEAARNAKNPETGKAGLLALSDLEGYQAVYRKPVMFSYRAPDGLLYNIYGATMPFSGPLTMNLILKQLEFIEHGTRTVDWGRFMDIQNAAFADRNAYMADADFVEVPVEELLAEGFAATRFAELFPGGKNLTSGQALATPIPAGALRGGALDRRSSDQMDHGTSHMSIVDADGFIVSMTTTVNGVLGARAVVPDFGMILNNQLCDFDLIGVVNAKLKVNAPEGGKRPRRTALGKDANSLGGKRPRSSMTPVIVEPVADAGQLVGAFGAPGGSDIIGGVTNVVRNFCSAGFKPVGLQQAVDKPRVIGKNQDGKTGYVEWELYHDENVRTALMERGYVIKTSETVRPYKLGETFSRVQSVVADFVEGKFYGAADWTRFPYCKAKAVQQLTTIQQQNGMDVVAVAVLILSILGLAAIGVALYYSACPKEDGSTHVQLVQDSVAPDFEEEEVGKQPR